MGYIAWYDTDGDFVGQIYGGSVDGMVLHSRNSDLTTWTEICINEGEIGPCPPVSDSP